MFAQSQTQDPDVGSRCVLLMFYVCLRITTHDYFFYASQLVMHMKLWISALNSTCCRIDSSPERPFKFMRRERARLGPSGCACKPGEERRARAGRGHHKQINERYTAIRILVGTKHDESDQCWCILKTMLVSFIFVSTTVCISLVCGERLSFFIKSINQK